MNVEKHRPTIKKLFAQFYANEINKRQLIVGLNKIEFALYCEENKDDLLKGIWFKFFKGDTTATTIKDLRNCIGDDVNHDYIMDKIKIALEKPKGLQIYYS
jgi:hypothetical protein